MEKREITAEIKIPIFYEPALKPNLLTVPLNEYIIQSRPATCLIQEPNANFAVTYLTTPKRSRSGTYERIHNLLSADRRVIIIPVVKDEGLNDQGRSSNFDVIQWDTISLLNLLDIHIIFAHYKSAEKHRKYLGKITNQKFDDNYIQTRLREFCKYSGSLQDWNLEELSKIPKLFEKSKNSYANITHRTRIPFYRENRFERLIKETKDLLIFRDKSRHRALLAQAREILTRQPNEVLTTTTKSTITITDFLKGKYFFTADEVNIAKSSEITITECKNSKSKLPSLSHIKDGLLKMLIFSNLRNVKVDGLLCTHKTVLQLTSDKISGLVSSENSVRERDKFLNFNQFNPLQTSRLQILFKEAE